LLTPIDINIKQYFAFLQEIGKANGAEIMGKHAFWGAIIKEANPALYSNLNIPKDDTILIAFDDTMTNSGKKGLVFTNSGLFYKAETYEDVSILPWKTISKTLLKAYSDCVYLKIGDSLSDETLERIESQSFCVNISPKVLSNIIAGGSLIFTGVFPNVEKDFEFIPGAIFDVNKLLPEISKSASVQGAPSNNQTENTGTHPIQQQEDYSKLMALADSEKISHIKDKYREFFGNSNMDKCCYFADSLPPKTSKNVYENLHIPKDESVFLFFDDTMFHSGKVGFAFTPEGVYAKMSNPFDRNAPTHSIWDIPWKDMPNTYHLSLGGHPILGNKSIMLAFTEAGKDIAQSSAVLGSTTADVQNNFEKIAELIVFMCILFTGQNIEISDER
jgi:hypothetical protein